ncbi:MAG: phosphonate metabolism protein/1,5-bisphosphokinase (PRPP-forming) PhnN [Rhodobacteraceae bacterium]|nr:phosphonate metabolism protein/1,5-bisphosphokinase (PRPP-forming) PhnN [Paracoccaceae bacterium]
MAGRLIAVVGPSGVGKDSVMAGLAAAHPGLGLVRRVITREADAGGEVFEPVSDAEFAARKAAGAFALDWTAHGLSYGVPASVQADLDRGGDLLVNLSRSVLIPAAQRFPGLRVLVLRAAPETLAARLAGRGRESADDIAARLARDVALPAGLDLCQISNDGALRDTVAAALAGLYPESAARAI